jgi:hypothetical protein
MIPKYQKNIKQKQQTSPAVPSARQQFGRRGSNSTSRMQVTHRFRSQSSPKLFFGTGRKSNHSISNVSALGSDSNSIPFETKHPSYRGGHEDDSEGDDDKDDEEADNDHVKQRNTNHGFVVEDESTTPIKQYRLKAIQVGSLTFFCFP